MTTIDYNGADCDRSISLAVCQLARERRKIGLDSSSGYLFVGFSGNNASACKSNTMAAEAAVAVAVAATQQVAGHLIDLFAGRPSQRWPEKPRAREQLNVNRAHLKAIHLNWRPLVAVRSAINGVLIDRASFASAASAA